MPHKIHKPLRKVFTWIPRVLCYAWLGAPEENRRHASILNFWKLDAKPPKHMAPRQEFDICALGVSSRLRRLESVRTVRSYFL